MINDKIFVSVLMSAYSEPIPMLKEAIDSILNQTHSNLEFFIYLDKPNNEELWRFLQDQAAKDSRLIVHKNEHNRLLAGTLNDELKDAKGDYIIRMDGDDISVPYRIEHLIDFMEAHPEVGVASSWMREFGNRSRIHNHVVKYDVDFEKMKVNYLCFTPIAHAPCIIRRKVIEEFGPALYNERCCKTQDYELWSRLINAGVVFGMVSEPLYLRRASHGDGPSPINYRVIHNQVCRRNVQEVLKKIGLTLPDMIDKQLADNIRPHIKESSGLLKNQLKMIQCVIYSNVYSKPAKRLWSMLKKGDLGCLSVLTLRMKIRFIRPLVLTELDNMVKTPSDLIYTDNVLCQH